jgi:hypothetical protein
VAALVIPKNGFQLTEDEIKDCLVRSGIEPFKLITGGVRCGEFIKHIFGLTL